MTNKEKYASLCEQVSNLSVFHEPFWLDAVYGPSGWDVMIFEKGGTVWGALPYSLQKTYGYWEICQPELTQFTGPVYRPGPAQKYEGMLSYEMEMFDCFARGLKDLKWKKLTIFFDPKITNWLPFYWCGYQQSTRYSYVFDDLTDIKKIWDGITPKTRTPIKNAETRYHLHLVEDVPLQDFISVNKMSFDRQGRKYIFYGLVDRLVEAAAGRKQGKLFGAADEDGRLHAVAFLVWNKFKAYYICGGADPHVRGSAAQSFLLWKLINYAAGVSRQFDFEGSMNPHIEHNYRSFGARQIPYFAISFDRRNLIDKIRCAAVSRMRRISGR
ncbi:MAG: GNAT family N-acetyltransferase [Lentisphaeria bacterium]|nr:GNAT family N-acetyltransferase [Lentisphaeria bacterium]